MVRARRASSERCVVQGHGGWQLLLGARAWEHCAAFVEELKDSCRIEPVPTTPPPFREPETSGPLRPGAGLAIIVDEDGNLAPGPAWPGRDAIDEWRLFDK